MDTYLEGDKYLLIVFLNINRTARFERNLAYNGVEPVKLYRRRSVQAPYKPF